MKGPTQFYSEFGITLGVLCILLYLYGFFPIKKSSDIYSTEHDLPSTLQDIKFNREKVYNGSASKTVLMIIDGLRVDFVKPENMPYAAGVVGGGRGGGCQLTARVAAPTVTLPRIKAIVTGSVSGFIDVVLNLGTVELTSDNIVQQFSNTKRAVFFGDDTWIKLFPRHFRRCDGTSSFFVNDYTEVDNNVTRHLDKELQSSDWDLMILHYLGLDHIGHIEGPKSSLIQPKLREMDGIIKRLQDYLSKQDGGVLVVCGDHGMKDSGSHGGVSLPEILVPVLVLGLACPQQFNQEILQVDLAATLSVLWGSPIPADNIGVVTPALITHLPPAQRLYAYLHNAQQLSANFLRNGGFSRYEGYQKYEEAKSKHYEWLVNASSVSHRQVEALYQEGLIKMSRFLSGVLANYNMPAMCSAILILFQVLFILGLKLVGNQAMLPEPSLPVVLVCVVLVGLLMITSLASTSQIILIASGFVFTGNSCLLYRQLQQGPVLFKYFRIFQPSLLSHEVIVPIGIVLFCLSVFSSSLIEEEHQLWYFLWATVCTMRLMESPIQWFAMLATHRFLRRLNSTGDKWAHHPDISDWLVQAENRVVLSLLCAASLLCVVWCCARLHYNRRKALIYLSIAFFIYQHKAAIQQVKPFFPSWQTNGVMEARICWILLLVLLLMDRSLRSLLICWMLLVSLLLRPYNTLLVPAMFVISRSVSAMTSNMILPLWIGSVFYFYQGNSNSLASVDIAAGFVGLEGYNVSLVAVLLFVHTYAMPILAYLLQVHCIVDRTRKWEQKLVACTELRVFVQLLHVLVCLIVITLQRYHLFVWTVFSPKLLYVAAQTFVCFVFISITNLCICYAKSRERLFFV